jgi:hypothetical protein
MQNRTITRSKDNFLLSNTLARTRRQRIWIRGVICFLCARPVQIWVQNVLRIGQHCGMRYYFLHDLTIVLTAFWLGVPGALIARGEWHIWTVTETRHVLRSEMPGSVSKVKIGAARNEWVDFQILLRSDSLLEGVDVEAGDLNGPRGAVLGRGAARVYRQHQLQLNKGTYRNEAFKPDWYPDPLIPFCHPITGGKLQGARFTAVPFDLPANETHGFWVDLLIPTNCTPGEYKGIYRLTTRSGGNKQINVSVVVWDFSLPPTPTLVTEFGSPRLRDYYKERAKTGGSGEPSDWSAVESQCAQLLSEHHFNATPPQETLTPKQQADDSFEIPSEQVRVLREFVDRYHVNAVQVPHPSSVVNDPDSRRTRLLAWLAAFDRAAKELDRPGVLFYTYLRDEPNTLQDYRYVQKWGRAIREAKSVVKVLVVEQPWTEPGQEGADSAWGDLYGAIDIWCPLFSLHRQESAAKRQALGEMVWTYTALCQGPPTPWWHIDLPLLNYRVPAWMAWRDGMKGLLYWGGMSYWRQTEDPWKIAPYYTGSGRPQEGEKGIIFYGEGSLVYPAHDVGYDGVVPTIRLKALRDSIQDYEYLTILQRQGKEAAAQKIVRSLTESFFQWDRDPVAYQKARDALAALITGSARDNAK